MHQEYDGKLEPLGLVDGEDAHGRGLDLRLGDRRVLAGLDQLVQVLHELPHVVVPEGARRRLHPIEELRDVLALGDVTGRLLAVHPAEPPRVLEEQVEQLTGRHLAAELHVALEIADEVLDGRVPLLGDLVAELGNRLGLAEDVEQIDVPPVRVGRAAREVDDRHLVQLRGRQVVQAHRLVGVDERAQERDQQPDLGPAVEPGVPRERPRDALEVERAQELLGVVVGADQNGHVVVPPLAAVDLLVDRVGDGVRLLRTGLVVKVRGRRALRLVHGHQVLADPAAHFETVRVVVDDEPVRGIEDLLVRPVVLGEHDLARLRIAVQKSEHVGDGRPAPPVDRLVVVADTADVAVPGAQQLHQLELGVIRILELVHHDVLEAALQVGANVGPRPQELHDQHDLIAEVDAALAGHQLLILGVGGGQLALLGDAFARFLVVVGRRHLGRHLLDVRLILLGRDVLVLAAADQRHDRADVPGRVAERAVVRERELEQAVAEEDHLLGAVEDAEIGLEPDLERVLAQEPVAERVERRDLDVGVAILHQRIDALLHLGRGLVGEGEREDLFGARLLLGDEPGDPPGDDRRLAGAGAGDDQQGAGVVRDGPSLLVVQAVEDPLTRHAASTITAGERRAARTSPPDVGSAGQEVGDVRFADQRDVAPRGALERPDRRARVDRILQIASAQHGPEKAGGVGIARSDRVDDLDGGTHARPVQASAVEHGGALPALLEADRRLRSETGERVERGRGRAGESEQRLRFRLADEEVANARQHGLEKRASVGR